MPESSFADFVGESLPSLSRYAYALTGERHASEDLVQDTLVKLAGAWRGVRRDGNPIGYARAVLFRTFVSRWRRQRRAPVLHEFHDEPAPGDQFQAVEARDALRRAMATLPRLQRAVLVLGYLDDMSDDEIAELLDRQPTTIRSLRYRGLHTLRKQLESHDLKEATLGTD